jgi:hypothetical protein
MRSPSAGLAVSRCPVPGDARTSPVGWWRSDRAPRDDDPDRGCEVRIRLDLAARRPVVCVAGPLEQPGGALLAAVLEYVRRTHRGPVALDLRGVSRVDRHGLAPVVESGAVVAGASPQVHRALSGLTEEPCRAAGVR